jgi:hypothetical protein
MQGMLLKLSLSYPLLVTTLYAQALRLVIAYIIPSALPAVPVI